METPDLPPLPPLPIGDQPGVAPADADAFRGILKRHRRRQVASGALALAVVLVAGGAAGFALGHGSGGTSHATQVAAGSPAASATSGASAGAAGASGVQGYAATPSAGSPQGGTVSSSGSGTVSGTVSVPPGGPTFTQLLLRTATDGTRVRLYEQQFTAPTFTCPPGAACPQPAMPACGPAGFISAEVSDDAVAGQIDGALWQSAPAETLEVVGLGIVGTGQPQPILVVIVHADPSVASVVLKTPYGTDTEAPTGQWAALAVQLPSDFSKSGADGMSSSTLSATDASGKPLVTEGLAQSRAIVPPCLPCPAVAQAPQAPPNTSGKAPSATGAVAPVPTPLPCQFPCPAVGSATKGAVPNIAMCVRPPLGAPGVPGAAGGGGGSSGSSVSGSASSGPATVVNP